MLHNYTQNFEMYFCLNKKKINQNVSEKFGHPYLISDGNQKKNLQENQGAFSGLL